MKGTSR